MSFQAVQKDASFPVRLLMINVFPLDELVHFKNAKILLKIKLKPPEFE